MTVMRLKSVSRPMLSGLAVDLHLVLIYVCRGGGADHKKLLLDSEEINIFFWLGYHRSSIDCCSYTSSL
jgi:hypothetical protein